MHQAKHKNNKAGPANKRALLDEPINYLDPLVQVAAPTVATIYRGTESVIHRLEKKYQRLLKIAWDGVGKGVSKKGIFFGAGGLALSASGKESYESGFNSDTDAGDTFCAERVLLSRLSVPTFKKLLALAIVANLNSEKDHGHEGARAPCHACREQFRRTIRDPSLPVIMASSRFDEIIVTKMGNLLPLAYLSGNRFNPAIIESFQIPTLKIFTREQLEHRSRNADQMATTILQVSLAAKRSYPDGVSFKKKFNLPGIATGVAAAVAKPVKIGSKTVYEDLILQSFSPNLGGKSAIRSLMADLQRSCGITGKVKVVGIHGQPSDFAGCLPVPSAGGRQAIYDRVFFQNENALLVMSMHNSNYIITVDARHLLPMGKPVMDFVDVEKHLDLARGLIQHAFTNF